MNVLVVGGTSGLGLELAWLLSRQGHKVTITGRSDLQQSGMRLIRWDLSVGGYANFRDMFALLPDTDMLIYAAGFEQQIPISKLSYDDIDEMVKVGLIAPMQIVSHLVRRQLGLGAFIAITSTSQSIRRPNEPAYAATKAGLGMFADSIADDLDIGRTLVAAPAGMNSPFWRRSGMNVKGWLDPRWVAEQILDQFSTVENYRYIKLLRDPSRVDVVDERP